MPFNCLPRTLVALLASFALFPAAGDARASAFSIGRLPAGALDAITDVAGVRVGQVTKIEGNSGPLVPGRGPVRTGVTVILPDADPWTDRVAAATYVLNGNGEMTGAHWVDESGFLETPIALTNTLDVGRGDDGTIDWLIRKHPEIGVDDDVPLPVVAECDDQGLNDIDGRHVSAADAVAALDSASTGDVLRGNVGAGTGMRAFGFKAGIGTASRVVTAAMNGYTVGVLVNANTGSREELRIDGVPVGRAFAHELLPTISKPAAIAQHGRAADGSVLVVIATDAPLDARQLRELAKRGALGLARTGITSHVSSGDLLFAFSTTHRYPRDPQKPIPVTIVNSDDVMDALFAATAEATEAAVIDALASAHTLAGARGLTFYAMPVARAQALVAKAKVSLPSGP
ncbi:MAG: P1 family peptidase [Candidatus Eremiobacteraeota bacterium]|nr:P1 family peptidase [Candidatus Eremiobacteraeota bacterium]